MLVLRHYLRDTSSWVINVPIGATFAGIGILVNAVSLLVWWRLYRRDKIKSFEVRLFLIALGIVDILILVLYIFNYTLPSAYSSVLTTHWYAIYYSYVGFPGFFVLAVCSVWFIVAVTLTRFMMVVFPLWRITVTAVQNKLTVLLIVGVSFLVNLPHFLTITPVQLSNSTWSVELTSLGERRGTHDYNFWSHCALFVVTPWMIIVAANSIIIQRLRSNNDKSTAIKRARQKQEKTVTYMLLAVTFSFLGLLAWQCLSLCLLTIKQLNDYEGTEWFYMEESMAVSKLCVVINSGVNCVIYSVTSHRFRKELRSIFCRRSRRIVSQDMLYRKKNDGNEGNGGEVDTHSSQPPERHEKPKAPLPWNAPVPVAIVINPAD